MAVDLAEEDRKTQDYFDRHVPHFSNAGHLRFGVDFINASSSPTGSLIDLGCGDGSTLEVFQRSTRLTHLAGLDVSERYLGLARERTGCETLHGSLLDPAIVERHEGAFDFAVLSQILHHLIGPNRAASAALAQKAVRNAFRLLRPGGALIVFEPSYTPRALMTGVFWIKKALAAVSDGRIEIFRKWANIGQPIVSYYTPDQLREMVRETSSARIVVDEALATSRLVGVLHFTLLGLVAEVSSEGEELAPRLGGADQKSS